MQITELAAKLQSVGLSDNQARVYVAALFLGASSAQKIAQQAEVNRATTYVILDELAEMGLVSQSTEDKKTVFVAEPPESLGRYLEAQKASLETKKAELKDLLPELKQNSRTLVEDAPIIRFYKGVEGIKSMYADSARKAKRGSVLYGFTNLDEVVTMLPDQPDRSSKSRLKKRISSKVFYSAKERRAESSRTSLRETKLLSHPAAADISIYEDRATLLTYRGKDSIAVAIESKELVQALRQLFELAWNNSKKDDKKY